MEMKDKKPNTFILDGQEPKIPICSKAETMEKLEKSTGWDKADLEKMIQAANDRLKA